MTEQEKTEWIKRNIENFSSEKEALEYLEKAIAEKKAKESRILRVFKNLDERNEFAKTHTLGKDWDYDSEKEGKLGFPESDGYEDFVSICAYEYVDGTEL